MSSRGFRRIAIAAIVAGTVSLAPPVAQAREIGWRDLGGFDRQVRGLLGSFHEALRRLFELSRGGMDPNGSPGSSPGGSPGGGG